MAELLIRVRDKESHPDPYVDVQRSKRGDVIVACPDGWNWSHEERTNPDWRIVRIPGLPQDEVDALVAPESGDRRLNPMLRRRAHSFDLDSADLPKAVRDAVADDKRSKAVVTVSAVIGRRMRKRKPPAVDPAVIG